MTDFLASDNILIRKVHIIVAVRSKEQAKSLSEFAH